MKNDVKIDRNKILLLCILVGCGIQCFIFYPGYIYWDSWVQLSQAQGSSPINDWHPPIMTLFWRLQLILFNTEKMFYAINTIVFWLALYLNLRIFSNKYLGIIALLIGFLPFVITYIAVPIKDVSLATSIFLCCGLLINIEFNNFSKRIKYFFYVIILALLFYCTLLRLNGIFITAPILIFIFYKFKNSIPIYAYLLITIFTCVLLSPYINRSIFNAENGHAIKSLLLFDIAGISYRSHEELFGIKPDNGEEIDLHQRCYTPKYWDSYAIYAGTPECGNYGQKILSQDDHYLFAKWISAIKKHPLLYLRHRFSVFNQFMNYQGNRPTFQYRYGEYPGIALYPEAENAVIYRSGILSRINILSSAEQVWFAPYFWLSILIGLFIATFKCTNRAESLINTIAFSAGIYLIGFFFIGVSDGYRYAYPSMLMCISGLLSYIKYKSIGKQNINKDKQLLFGFGSSLIIILLGVIL